VRDILITLIVVGSIPFILKRPWFGIMMWVWLSVMNPHRLTFGFAYDFPFAMVVAIATLLSMPFSTEPKRFPWSSTTVTLLLFIFWMNVSTLFALQPVQAYTEWSRVMRTMLMLVVMLMLLYKREHIQWLVWVLVGSLAFYGVKGGIFTVLGGAENRVWGPPNSYIEDNNALAVALIMIVPLMWYVRLQATKRWVRWGLAAAMALTAAAALGSYSRGALLAIIMMLGFLWWKSTRRVSLAILLLVAGPVLIGMMPDKWFVRMDSIGEYQQDSSAMGRLNAWQMALNLARDRPLVGGGFQIYDPPIFQRYAPDPEDIHSAHSIYFAALGEHGFVGLALMLVLGLFTWFDAGWIVRHTKKRPDMVWASNLALMCQVSLVCYAVGGAFLSILYFDLPYYLIAILVLLKRLVKETLAQEEDAKKPASVLVSQVASLRPRATSNATPTQPP
jgi:putative inorganic carbon (HCO3(-)) transporter